MIEERFWEGEGESDELHEFFTEGEDCGVVFIHDFAEIGKRGWPLVSVLGIEGLIEGWWWVLFWVVGVVACCEGFF